MEKMLVNTYGATIADAMVAKMLTADKLTQMLKSGNLDAPGVPSFAGLPALANLPTGNWLSLLGRLNFIQPVPGRHPHQRHVGSGRICRDQSAP